jgi:hypothetical protein
MDDPAKIAENRDLLAHLRKAGFATLVDAAGDPDCLRAGRLSGNAIARKTGTDPRHIWRMMREAREGHISIAPPLAIASRDPIRGCGPGCG